jgi:hypothetical protein
LLRQGYIEFLEQAGVGPASMDLVISNCVINLSPSTSSASSYNCHREVRAPCKCRASAGSEKERRRVRKGVEEREQEQERVGGGGKKLQIHVPMPFALIYLTSVDKPLVLKGVYDALRDGGELYFSDVYCDRRLSEVLLSYSVLLQPVLCPFTY